MTTPTTLLHPTPSDSAGRPPEPSQPRAMTVGGLFSGIGGIELGLERAGMRIKWTVENDPFCQKVLAKHWPRAMQYGDVRDCGARNLEPVDLIAGGFPCQDVSTAGKRKGLQGEQSGLWSEFARIIRALKPKWVLVENVSGLLSVNSGRDFGTVLGDLAACGYDAEWDCIPAAAFGAPHLRYRVFVVAYTESGGIGRQGEGDENSRMGLASGGQGFLGASPISKVAYTSEPRLERPPQPAVFTSQCSADVANAEFSGSRAEIFSHETIRKNAERSTSGISRSSWWTVEPGMGRVAHGIPNRIHRLRALGNAVVPQCAEWIGRRIVEAERAYSMEVDR